MQVLLQIAISEQSSQFLSVCTFEFEVNDSKNDKQDINRYI